ncbi:MAG: DNA polymerase/3'-5' exonuclease PolX [Deltaproteobacteria bacterium]|nr:DNA polymerase/3'-5' exonuclease PolX [Deltaproteobacteria bacterium]
MENREIARVFFEIADLLEIKGENPFRIRSYRNAGEAIEGLPESLAGLYEKGEQGLKGIHGIGEGIREKIIELLTTAECFAHQELLKEFPKGLLDMRRVSGIGPKKAYHLYKELGIAGIDALEKAALEGRLHGLVGFGERTEEVILKAIKGLKAATGRFKLFDAMQYADAFILYIKKVPGVVDAVPAGSLRRWKESIGDVDILSSCKNPDAVMDAFVQHPDVGEIVSKGETRSTVILKTGLQVDIRVVDEKCFGAALQYFTGSKAHNIALRERAKKLGLKISEYGVFKEKGDKWIAGRTEEDVYKAVGLPWIRPELRENMGEIEAALDGKLPEELKSAHIKGDLHVHSSESDGNSTIEEMADAAMKLGYEYIAITDHSKAVGIAHGLDEKRLLNEIKAIDELNGKYKKQGKNFRVLKGAEVDIRGDGTLDHPESALEKLDCVVAAIHSGFGMTKDRMTTRIVKAISTGKINILAHPTGRLVGTREPYDVDMEKVMDEAKKHSVCMELNSFPDRLDLKDAHIRLAKEKGLMVAISTDSHSPAHLSYIVFGVHTAMRGWIERKDVINTRPLKEIMKMLKKGR